MALSTLLVNLNVSSPVWKCLVPRENISWHIMSQRIKLPLVRANNTDRHLTCWETAVAATRNTTHNMGGEREAEFLVRERKSASH